jgi:nitrate/nitrite-specific signal transduction histidine kinase
MRHSCAAQLILNISSNGPHNFSFVIEDDGKGFTQNQGYPGHYGLENMRARANDLGAALEIISEEKNGTIVKLFKS